MSDTATGQAQSKELESISTTEPKEPGRTPFPTKKMLMQMVGSVMGGAIMSKVADSIDAMRVHEDARIHRMARAIYENEGVKHTLAYADLTDQERAPYRTTAKAARDAMEEPKPPKPPLAYNDAYSLKPLIEAGERFADQESIDRIENLLADLHAGFATSESEEKCIVDFATWAFDRGATKTP